MDDEKKQKIMRLIEQSPRITLAEIYRQTGIPMSTAWDYIQQIEQEYILFAQWFKKEVIEE